MADAGVEDLLSFDRDVARGASALARWREGLVRDPEAHAGDDPLADVRRVAGKSAWDALRLLAPSAADVPLRDALRPWVYALTQARIGGPDEVAWARSATSARGRFEGEPPRRVSWRDAWRGVAAAKTPAEARLWLDAAADGSTGLAEIALSRASRRMEVARRLGLEHPWSPLVPVDAGALRAAARRLLDATEDLSRAVWKSALREGAGVAGVLQAAVARDAGEGWPARLTARWLEETFASATRGLTIELPPMPATFGASSFARGLYAFGYAVRAGPGSPSTGRASTPYALARAPAFVDAHRFAFLFAALPADPEWQVRALGLGRRGALAQARVLGRTALLDARLHAARLLLGDEAAFAPRDLFDEIGPRLFGVSLDARLRGAWPLAHEDEPARMLALLDAQSFAASLRDRFDVDWFRNPGAWAHLRARAAGPAAEGPLAPREMPALPAAGQASVAAGGLEARASSLARAFEESLG
jgi:hypothetical protein